MRRVFYTFGFLLAMIIAASSFASVLGVPEKVPLVLAEQSYLIPKGESPGIDECLASQSDCGRAAAETICESKGYAHLISFGEAAPEDMTGSIAVPAEKQAAGSKPFLVTCGK